MSHGIRGSFVLRNSTYIREFYSLRGTDRGHSSSNSCLKFMSPWVRGMETKRFFGIDRGHPSSNSITIRVHSVTALTANIMKAVPSTREVTVTVTKILWFHKDDFDVQMICKWWILRVTIIAVSANKGGRELKTYVCVCVCVCVCAHTRADYEMSSLTGAHSHLRNLFQVEASRFRVFSDAPLTSPRIHAIHHSQINSEEFQRTFQVGSGSSAC